MEIFSEIARIVSDAYLKREYRPVAVAIIKDRTGGILFVRSAKNPNEWYLPQGGIEDQESVESALFREIAEELRIDRTELKLLRYLGVEDLGAEQTRVDKRGFSKGKRYFFFVLNYIGSQRQFEFQQEEICECGWIGEEKIAQTLSTTRPEKRKLIMRWLGKL